MQLCVTDAHEGPKNAIAKVLSSPWQRCTVHCLRDMLGHCSKAQQPMIAAAVRQIFAAEEELLAFMAFPAEPRSKLRSTNPLEHVNREIGRRSDVVGIYPNDGALVRLAGALLIEHDDEWLVGRRYLREESLAAVFARSADAQAVVDVSALPAA
jgi:putative transposase